MNKSPNIGIALSGGGVRAIAFHSGVLKWLAENDGLKNVNYISSVSGGSLFAGLVFEFAGLKWPGSAVFMNHVFPSIRTLITEESLQGTALKNLLFDVRNWKFLFSRANVIAKTIESLWGVTAPVSSLPGTPVWAINGTTGETGLRFQIKGAFLGDYDTGYSEMPGFKLAAAMAVSAAFPVGIGPLSIRTRGATWMRRKSWQDSSAPEVYVPPYRILHLYDGGLYDNLGIEPLFDVGTQKIKLESDAKVDTVLVSDASPALHKGRIPFFLNPLRAKRLIDITLSQVRALRVRSFVNFLESSPERGSYFRIGSFAPAAIQRLGNPDSTAVHQLSKMEWMTESDVQRAASYPTTLRRMAASDFDALARHGYETAVWNSILWT
jgi:NTE family protein